tara:strand:+ start:40470 stop:40670 length:201 start_codon:yes stop_codon:yes gene_type:complete
MSNSNPFYELLVELNKPLSAKCKDCTYDERGRLTHTCGPCEEEAIKARIQWWQDGKKKLKEKEHDG